MKRILLLLAMASLATSAARPSAAVPVRSAGAPVRSAGAMAHDLIHPLRPVGHGSASSTNWSGYAVYGGGEQFTGVSSTWTHPSLSCPGGRQYSSFWVGIDGYVPGSLTVQQIGTAADCDGKGNPSHYAWYEMFPSPPVTITSVPIRPGDVVHGEVRWQPPFFVLSIVNRTTGRSYSTSQVAVGATLSSAEWVAEAPTGVDCGCVLPLARFGYVDFAGDYATAGGHTGSISDARWSDDKVTMRSGSTVKATPGPLWFDGTKFRVTWNHT